MSRALAIALAAAFSGCASPHTADCHEGTQPAVQDVLHFGTAKPDGEVMPEEWDDFLRASVTPRFPQGLSVTPSAGQWRGADGAIVRERSYALLLVHPGEAAHDAAVRAIMAEYKTRFRQEAVLRVRSRACVAY